MVLFVTGIDAGQAQSKYLMRIIVTDASQQTPKLSYKSIHRDSLAIIRHIQQIISSLHKKSFLLASADSIAFYKDSVNAYIHTGNQFKWAELRPGNVDEGMLSYTGYREKLFQDRLFSYRQVANLQEKVLEYADNQGYPFSSIYLDSLDFADNRLRASLHYIKGPYIIFDSLAIQGTASLKNRFLSAYLKIPSGQPFSQQKVQQAERLLRQLPYLTITQPYHVIFKNDRAYPVFYANQTSANSIDGIIGFLPNEQAGNKLLVTGELNLQLQNLFNSGKAFSLKWQQIRPKSPRLDISYEHPALLGTPFILKSSFSMLKEDTTFLNIDRQLSLAYVTGNAGKIIFLTGLKNSRLGNNSQYRENTELPVFSDYKYFYYGIGYEWNRTNDFYNPVKGVNMTLGVWAGNKNITKNPFIDQNLYATIDLQSIQLTAKFALDVYIPLYTRSVGFTGIKLGKVLNENLFKNDLFRLGGLKSLRGFNENFFFASDYAVLTLEYRYFIEPASYLFLFYDQAYIKHSILGSYYEDHPLGTGAGVSFTTKLGTFQLIYAMGKSQERKFDFNFARIHFGMTSKF